MNFNLKDLEFRFLRHSDHLKIKYWRNTIFLFNFSSLENEHVSPTSIILIHTLVKYLCVDLYFLDRLCFIIFSIHNIIYICIVIWTQKLARVLHLFFDSRPETDLHNMPHVFIYSLVNLEGAGPTRRRAGL